MRHKSDNVQAQMLIANAEFSFQLDRRDYRVSSKVSSKLDIRDYTTRKLRASELDR